MKKYTTRAIYLNKFKHMIITVKYKCFCHRCQTTITLKFQRQFGRSNRAKPNEAC